MKSIIDETILTTHNQESAQFWTTQHLSEVSWSYKACVYHRHLWDYISIPDSGDVVQLGIGFGLSLEILCNRFPNRTYGVDLYNPGDHPKVRIGDVRNLTNTPLAYVHCNVGNFDTTPNIRRVGLEWSLENLVPGGYCCTAGNHPYVEDFLGFKIKDLAAYYGCEVYPMPACDAFRLMNTAGKYNSEHDCLIRKL